MPSPRAPLRDRTILLLIFLSSQRMVSSTSQADNNPSPKTPVCNDNEISKDWMFLPVIKDEVIHFKVASNSLQLEEPFAPLKQKLVYRLYAYPGVGRSMSLDSCFPVIVTELNDNDFGFKQQPLCGTPVSQPYAVFKTRVPDYRNAVSNFFQQAASFS